MGPHGAPQVRVGSGGTGALCDPLLYRFLRNFPGFCFKKGQNQLNKCTAIWCSMSMKFRLIVQLQCKV